MKRSCKPARKELQTGKGGGCRSQGSCGSCDCYARLRPPVRMGGPSGMRRSGGAPPYRAPVVEGLERASLPPARRARGCGGAAGRSGWKSEKEMSLSRPGGKGGGVARSPSAR